MANDGTMLLIAGTGLLALLGLATLAVRLPKFFLALVMLWYAAQTTNVFHTDPVLVVVGDINILIEDLITLVAGVAVLVRLRSWQVVGVARRCVCVWAAIIACGLASFVVLLGPQTGVNQWRTDVLSVVLLMFATTIPGQWTWRDLGFLLVVPACLAAVGNVVFVLQSGLGSAVRDEFGARPSANSLLVLVGMWIALQSPQLRGIHKWGVVAFLGVVVVVAQHRSVWIAALAGAIAWVLLPRTSRFVSMGMPARFAVAGLAFAGAVVAVGSSNQLSASAEATNTLEWRIGVWTDSFETPRSFVEWLFGSAFGPTPVTTQRLYESFSHSTYVNAVEYIGLVGLGVLVMLLLLAATSKLRDDRSLVAVPRFVPIGGVLVASFAGYGLFYDLVPWTWGVIGILLSIRQRQRDVGHRRPADQALGADARVISRRERQRREPGVW